MRDFRTELRRGRAFCSGHSREVPRQAARLQLLDLIQLETETNRLTDRILQQRLGKIVYKFQFVKLSGFHALNLSMFELATAQAAERMFAYSKLRHQRSVGTSHFDLIPTTISGGETSTNAKVLPRKSSSNSKQ